MSVLPSDIVVYGSANMPEADGTMTGGPIDFTRRVAFYDLTAVGSVDVVSSSSSDTTQPRSLIADGIRLGWSGVRS